jgi:indole-3-glycerol phosphate synthase
MTILDRILEDKAEEVAECRRRRPLPDLIALSRGLPAARDFAGALRGSQGMDGSLPRIIAEVKKASPSQGVIRPDFDPVAIACAYAAHGAAALSVLTDEKYFQGKLEFLGAIRQAVSLPLLRKDFTIDPYQLYEARVAGADAILLIAAALEDGRLEALLRLAEDLGLAAVVEVHTLEELERVLPCRPRIVGINNRDLQTFRTDIETTLRLLPLIPPGVLVVSESGLQEAATIAQLQDKGVHAFLIGESLMRATDPGLKLRELLHGERQNLRHHEP